MKAYKSQSENEHQRWFRDIKIKMMNVSKYFIIDKVKILWCMQFLKDDLITQWFTHTFDGETITADQVIYLKFKQFLLNLIIDSINRRLIVYEKFDATHQKIDQKISVFKIYLKEIKKELSFFDEYHKAMLFLVKLIPVLKNKLLIMRNVSNIRKIILFKVIMQKIILNRTREDDGNHNFQQKDNKSFEHQFNRNQQSDKSRHFNNSEKNNKSENYFEAQTQNKRTHAKMKNKKNNRCFECHKSDHFHRNCFERNKWSKTIIIKVAVIDAKKDDASSAFRKRSQKNQ